MPPTAASRIWRPDLGLADRKGALNTVLAALIVVVALYMLYRTATELGWL